MLNGWWNRFPKNILPDVSEHTQDVPELERCEFHHLFVIDDVQRGRRNSSILKYAEWVATGFTESQFHCWKRLPDPPQIKIEREKGDAYVGQLEPVTKAHIDPESKQRQERFLGYFYSIPKTSPTNFVPHEQPPYRIGESLIIPLPKKDQSNTTEWTVADKWHNRYDHWAKIKGELWKVRASHIMELDLHMMNNKMFKRQRVIVEIPLKCVYNGTVERTILEQEAFMYVGIPSFWEDQIDAGYLWQPMTVFSSSSLNRKYYSYTNLEANE